MNTRKVITYVYRARIERRTEWCDGYSKDSADGLPTYPLMTRRECKQDAKRQGCKAEFLRRSK
jgi:hypothetical protein